MGNLEDVPPGTQLVKRLKRDDPPRTLSDKESQAHDSRYFMASSPADVRKADMIMINVMKRLKKNKLDDPLNIAQGLRLIQAKNKLETATGKNYVDFGPGPGEEKDRPLVKSKLAELEKEGYGKNPADRLRKKLLQNIKKQKKTKNMKGEGVVTDLLEKLSLKAGTALLPHIKKYVLKKIRQSKKR